MSVCANCFVWFTRGSMVLERKPCRNPTGPCTEPEPIYTAADLARARREARKEALEEAAGDVLGWTGHVNTPENAAVVSAVCRGIAAHLRALAGTPDATKEETT